jgi:hypothetical protein
MRLINRPAVFLWLDDRRPAPSEWRWVKTVAEAIALMQEEDVEAMSLDHDLDDASSAGANEHEPTGLAFVEWMVANRKWPKQKPLVHSANDAGRERMKALIDQHWRPSVLPPALAPKAVPLTSPEGVVFAYACGTCRHVQGGVSKLVVLTDEDVACFAESSRKQAERCCTCEECHCLLARGSRGVGLHSRVCAACLPKVEAEWAAHRDKVQQDRRRYQEKLEASLGRAKNRAEAVQLVQTMRMLSEEHFMAGWLDGLEFDLWAMVQGGSRSTVLEDVSVQDVNRLRVLAAEAGGWWRYEHLEGELFVTTEEWLPMVERHRAEMAARAARADAVLAGAQGKEGGT